MNGSSLTFEDVQARCTVNEDIDHYAIESWLKSAKTIYQKAQLAQEDGQFVDAYIYYSKTYDICYTGAQAMANSVHSSYM